MTKKKNKKNKRKSETKDKHTKGCTSLTRMNFLVVVHAARRGIDCPKEASLFIYFCFFFCRNPSTETVASEEEDKKKYKNNKRASLSLSYISALLSLLERAQKRGNPLISRKHYYYLFLFFFLLIFQLQQSVYNFTFCLAPL